MLLLVSAFALLFVPALRPSSSPHGADEACWRRCDDDMRGGCEEREESGGLAEHRVCVLFLLGSWL